MIGRGPRQGDWRFLQLTLFIGAWMLLSPQFQDRWFTHVLLQAFLLNAVLVTLWANPGWHHLRAVTVGLWAISLAGSAVALAELPERWDRIALTAEKVSLLPLLVLLAVGSLRFVSRRQRLTSDGIFATVVVYAMIAMFFAEIYELMLLWNPTAVTLPVPASQRPSHLLQVDLLYYSIMTLATVGYGDILPVSATARMIASIEAIVGQFYVAVIVAVFVGMYATQRKD